MMSPQVSWLFFKAVRAGLAVKRPYLDSYGSIRRGGGKQPYANTPTRFPQPAPFLRVTLSHKKTTIYLFPPERTERLTINYRCGRGRCHSRRQRPERHKIPWLVSRQGEECGDFPVFEANPLTLVFQEVPKSDGTGSVPVQFQYSVAVHGPEGPNLNPDPLAPMAALT
jgi:hypothetical protein